MKYSIIEMLLPVDRLIHQNITEIYLCAYKIDKSGNYPFLKFILEKKANLYNFPRFILQKEYHSLHIMDVLKSMIRLYIIKTKIRWNERIDGVYLHNNRYYLFIDMTETSELGDMNIEQHLCFALIDEMINSGHIFETKISNEVSDFLLANIDFCYLRDDNNDIYESPTVVYICEKVGQLQFQCTFGVSAKDKDAILGSYYYFTNYENATRHVLLKTDETEIIRGINKDINQKYGIIRFAIFLGNTKIIIPEKDKLDNSQIKIHRILNPARVKHVELITQQISDHDGEWTEEYSSCFLGNIKLENVIELKNIPIYVIKEHDKQIGLNYKLYTF